MPDCSFRSTSEILKAGAALVAATILALAGCAGGISAIPIPTAKNVELAGRHGQPTTLPALKVGRSLYISRCGSCHSLHKPGFLVPADWPEMVERMVENSEINPDQQRAITHYLVSASAAIHDTTAAPETGPIGAEALPPATPANL